MTDTGRIEKDYLSTLVSKDKTPSEQKYTINKGMNINRTFYGKQN
jgi:hypothetical protein